MSMESATKEGRTTSEHGAAKSSGIMGIVAMVLGALTAVIGPMVQGMGGGEGGEPQTPWVVIAGGVIAIAGVLQKTLADLSYVRSRTEVKVNALKNGS